MATVLLPTGTATFNDLISNGRVFRVPPYQRDYSWAEEQWEDLWLDILEVSRGEETFHYMGYVVLQSDDNRNFIIIDGQQRITTLSILVLAVIKLLGDWADEGISSDQNQQRQELLTSRFISQTDVSSLMLRSKLFLNRNNDDFYQSRLLRLRPPTNRRKLKPSQRLLWEALEYLYERLKERFEDERDGAMLTEFLEKTVADKLVFTTITVADDLNAYKVFETLNARGVRLSTTDLLKNFLFSVAARGGEADLEEAERQWQSINDSLSNKDFPSFLRYYWNSKYSFQRKQTLFKAIKSTITTRESVFSLLEDLEDLVEVFVALSKPADDLWEKEQVKWIDALDLFRVRQCYPLLLAAYRKLDSQEFTKLLRLCVAISFRYNVISGLNPNLLEDVYHRAAVKVTSGRLANASNIFTELKSIYIDDERFKANFALKTLQRNNNLIRYILFELENQLASTAYDYSDNMKATIEHILPENASEAWGVFFSPEEQDKATQRIGNLTLLEPQKNKVCANKPYEQKLPIYRESVYKLTSERSIYNEWTPLTLKKRQEKLADLATTVWKAPFNT